MTSGACHRLTLTSTIMPPTTPLKASGPVLCSTAPTHGLLWVHLILLIIPSLSRLVAMLFLQHTTSVSVVKAPMSVTSALTTTPPHLLLLLQQCCLLWIQALTGIPALSCSLPGLRQNTWLATAFPCHLPSSLHIGSLSLGALFPTICLLLMAILGHSTPTSSISSSCNGQLQHTMSGASILTSGKTSTSKAWPVWHQLIISVPTGLPSIQQPTKHTCKSWKKLSTSTPSGPGWLPLSLHLNLPQLYLFNFFPGHSLGIMVTCSFGSHSSALSNGKLN